MHFILHRIEFIFGSFEAKVKQRYFPIKLAFSTTVQDSHGKTLAKMIINSGKNFSPGKVHIELSRVRKSEQDLLIYKEEGDHINAKVYHSMNANVKEPVLIEAVEFVERIQMHFFMNCY